MIEPSGCTPPSRRFLPRTRRAIRPLTPHVATCAPKRARRQDSTPRCLVKGNDCIAPRAPSLDECQLDPRLSPWISSAGPPPIPKLRRSGSASDALSPGRSEEHRARRTRFSSALHARAQFATRRPSTSAIDHDPQARIVGLRLPCSNHPPRLAAKWAYRYQVRLRDRGPLREQRCNRGTAAEGSRVRGLGAMTLSGPLQAPLDAMARAGSFTPTRFGSDTPCHPSAPTHGRSCRTSMGNGPSSERMNSNARPDCRFRGRPGQGRLTRLFAKRNAVRRTRGAFPRETPLSGAAPLHRFFRACGQGACAFSISTLAAARTVRNGVRGLGLRSCTGKPVSKREPRSKSEAPTAAAPHASSA